MCYTAVSESRTARGAARNFIGALRIRLESHPRNAQSMPRFFSLTPALSSGNVCWLVDDDFAFYERIGDRRGLPANKESALVRYSKYHFVFSCINSESRETMTWAHIRKKTSHAQIVPKRKFQPIWLLDVSLNEASRPMAVSTYDGKAL